MKKYKTFFTFLLLFAFENSFAQFSSGKWYVSVGAGNNDVEYYFNSFLFSDYNYQTNAPTFTISGGYQISPLAKKAVKWSANKKKWQSYIFDNIGRSTIALGVGARNVRYGGFKYISTDTTIIGKRSLNQKDYFNIVYATVNLEYTLPISKIFALNCAYESQYPFFASRKTDKYYLTNNSRQITENVSKDNFRDSLNRRDALWRYGITVKPTKSISFTYYRCVDPILNLSNGYIRQYSYFIQEVAFKYIF